VVAFAADSVPMAVKLASFAVPFTVEHITLALRLGNKN